jgi:MFS family permease
MVNTTDVCDKTSVSTSLSQAWLVTMVSGLFFFYEFIQLNMFNTLTPHLMRDFAINAEQAGIISSYYFWAEISMLFIAGIIIDRVSTKKLILFFMTTCVASTLLFAYSHSITVAIICRFMEGLGAAFCFMSSLKIASEWLPPKQVALASGLLVTMAMMGGVIAQTPMASLIDYTGSWRSAMVYNAGLGLCFMAIISLLVKDKHVKANHDKLDIKEEKSQIVMALKNTQNWLAGIYTCLVNLPIFIFGAMFGVLYLTQVHHFSITQASEISSMVFWGTIFGSPFYGWLSDRLSIRKLPMIIGAVLSLAVIAIIMTITQPSFALFASLFFALGFITSSQIITYPLVTECNPKHITATSLGIASTIIMSGGAIFQPMFGALLQKNWDGTMADGVSIYSAADFHTALMILPIAFIVSIVAACALKETHCKHVD